jgi:thioredoxin 1
MINSVIHTNQHSIDRVLGAGVPVLLVFTSPNTPLAAELSTGLDTLASRYAGKLLVAQIDARDEPALVSRFGARQTPAVVVVRNGEALERLSGRVAIADVEAWAKHLVDGGPRPAAVRPPPVSDPVPPSPTQASSGSNDAHPVVLSDATFAQALQSPLPVLVDFWAPWCGPCRMIAPSVEQLARTYAGRAVIAKMNVDDNPATPGQFGIRGIPTLIIFKGGKVAEQIVGAQPYQELEKALKRHL